MEVERWVGRSSLSRGVVLAVRQNPTDGGGLSDESDDFHLGAASAGQRVDVIIHPPIDRTLLQRLAATAAIDAPQRARWKSVAWTKLTEEEYYSLLAELRAVLADGDPWWKLEEYWNVASD